MIKYEKGRNRPTENRAVNSILSQEVDTWVKKIDAASNQGDVQYGIKMVGDVLVELAKEIRVGRADVEVFKGLQRRRNLSASIVLVTEKLARELSGTSE